MRLAWLDYVATLRERKSWLAAAILAYAVLAMPVLLERPPAHVSEAISLWFGSREPFVLFMYIWIDLAMNKVITFLPVILASGVVLRERDIGVLAILSAKPLSLPRYYVLRTISACAVMATLHLLAQGLGCFWFAVRVPGFRSGVFLAAMSLHVFAAIFGTTLAAALAVWTGRRGTSFLCGIGILSMMSGMALIGFYNPAWRAAALVNPYAIGAQALGYLGSLGSAVLVPRMLALLCLSAVTLGLGALGARRMEV